MGLSHSSSQVFGFFSTMPAVFLGFPCASDGKEPACKAGDVLLLGWEDPLEKGMATHSSILAWRTPRTEEPGGLHCGKESDPAEQLTLPSAPGALGLIIPSVTRGGEERRIFRHDTGFVCPTLFEMIRDKV